MARIRNREGHIQALLLLLSIIPTRINSQSQRRGIAFQELIEPYVTRTYNPGNPSETCYEVLHDSDANSDGLVTNDEYSTFVAHLSEGDFNVTNYIDLPFVLKVNFVYLSCLCRFRPEFADQGSKCCEGPDGGIYVDGAAPGEVPTAMEEAYLTTVCEETQGAIDYARNATEVPSEVPTVSPTRSPSAEPTKSPTDPPSESPSKEPTQSPSATPTTLAPTTSPTTGPTNNPTAPPTLAPSTTEPTTSPTSKPTTGSPTAKPTTLAPSLSPNTTPTTEMPTTPVPVTSEPTTKAPIIGTASPTVELTSQPSRAPIVGTAAPSVTPTAKIPVVPTTAAPTDPDSTKAPTQYPSVSIQPSPTKGSIVIPPPGPDTPPTPSAPSTPPPTPPAPGSVELPPTDRGIDDAESETISSGGIAGIVLAAAFMAYVAVYLVARKNRREEEDPELMDVRNKDLDDLEAGVASAAPQDDEERKEEEGPEGGDGGDGSGGGAVAVGAYDAVAVPETTDYDAVAVPEPAESFDAADYIIPQSSEAASPRSPPPSSDVLVSAVPPSPQRSGKQHSRGDSHDDSSSAGESGWSSSAGMSSLNTASFDAGTDDGLLPGSPDMLLRTIGAADSAAVAAGSTQRDAKPTFVPVDDGSSSSGSDYDLKSPLNIHSDHPAQQPIGGSKVTREDLNRAIEAGDWAVVGATAALLADNNNTDNNDTGSEAEGRSTASRGSFYSSSTGGNSEHRAEELDRMVEKGDWEGVVLAAAQFEGSSSGGDGLGKEEDSRQSSNNLSSHSSGHTKASQRAEVERLVRRVVPDEIDNIDEMMLQFDGREDELIETLRTMQERSVAQRARAAVQKTAKLEARAKASLAASATSRQALDSPGSTSSSGEPSHYEGSTNSSMHSSYAESPGNQSHDSSVSDSSVSDLGMNSGGNSDNSSSRRSAQSSLELAIERGDWRAVGEAAAMMGEGSAIPDENSTVSSDDSATASTDSDEKARRAYRLDSLIARGDWAGIVAVAGKYQALDDQGAAGPPTEEEREALAQADMWQEIADQSRQGKAEAKGAEDAADWAIARSLERKLRGEEGDEVEGDHEAKKPRIEDDESV